ncbi:hypothetical protein JXA80_01795 [bacterium]|nr:hypothetical protein [candidate division CSSED10-310 bacterium]
MGLTILGSIGAKLGFDVVGNIMEKTLPKAADFMKIGSKTPLDAFEAVIGTFGGKTSQTKPAEQFSLAFPKRLGFSSGAGFADTMKSIGEKLSKFLSVMEKVNDVVGGLSHFFTGKVEKAPFQGHVEMAKNSGFGSGLNVDTTAMAQSSGYSTEKAPGGSSTDPMAIFQKMQEAQAAAQMFELAVKISEIQHQAAMSAIRGIRY